MLKFLRRVEIDNTWWDALVNQCHNPSVMAFSWYLDIVCSKRWSAIVDEEKGIIMPLPVRDKWGIKYVFQPKFIQQLGVFSKVPLSEEEFNACLEAIPKQIKWVNYNLNAQNVYKRPNLIQELQTNVMLHLSKSIDELRDGYRMNTKRNVRKSFSHPVSMVYDCETDDIIKLFKQNKGQEISAFSESDYVMLTKILEELKKRELLLSWGAHVHDKLAAGAFFVKNFNKYVFLFSGQNDEGRANQALTFIIDNFIEQHAKEDLYLDFEGSTNPNLARYYKGFGGVEEKYPMCIINKLPWYISWLK